MSAFRIYGDVAQFLPVPRLPSVPVNTRSCSLLAVTAGMVMGWAQIQGRMKLYLKVEGWALLGPKRPIPWLQRHEPLSEHPLCHRPSCCSSPSFSLGVYTSAALV